MKGYGIMVKNRETPYDKAWRKYPNDVGKRMKICEKEHKRKSRIYNRIRKHCLGCIYESTGENLSVICKKDNHELQKPAWKCKDRVKKSERHKELEEKIWDIQKRDMIAVLEKMVWELEKEDGKRV